MRSWAVGVVLAALVSCSPSGRTEILVFAAASLTESFREIGGAFERTHPDVTVRFNFGSSGGLATQITEGAPADVFASASTAWMDAVASDVRDPATFARNGLVVLVPAADPAMIGGVRDLARPGVSVVLAAEGVPAGDYAREALARAGVLDAAVRNVVSNEDDVKGVVQKVLLDEVDAGIAYATDVTSDIADRVRAIGIRERWNVVASYRLAVVGTSVHAEAARAFMAFVLDDGRAILERAGFR